jgi:glycosyltransferase involved in cell wall biosynthesis
MTDTSAINFSICLIGKNESLTIPRLIKSMGNFIVDGGKVYLLDTGSTDDTVAIARSLGITVTEVGEKYITTVDKSKASKMNKRYIVEGEEPAVKAGERVFDFGSARQESHTYAKTDMILSVDCSDVFEAFDYKCLSDIISEGKKTKFNYYMLNGEGPGAVRVQISRFYSRSQFQWKCRVHECLYGDFHVNQAMTLSDDILLTKHIKTNNKERIYVLGMILDIASKTHLSRSMYYLAREFYYHGRWKSAIKLMKQYCELKEAWFIEKSSGYCIIAECYEKLNDIESAVANYQKAFDVFPNRRTPLIKLGYLYDALALEEKDGEKKALLYRKALVYATGALEIPFGKNPFEEDSNNYTYRAHEIIYRACSNLGEVSKGRIHYKKAIELSGGASWMLCHAKFFEEK